MSWGVSWGVSWETGFLLVGVPRCFNPGTRLDQEPHTGGDQPHRWYYLRSTYLLDILYIYIYYISVPLPQRPFVALGVGLTVTYVPPRELTVPVRNVCHSTTVGSRCRRCPTHTCQTTRHSSTGVTTSCPYITDLISVSSTVSAYINRQEEADLSPACREY